VGKNIGRGIVEFKKGLRGIEDDMDQAVHEDTSRIEHDEGPPPHIESNPETKVADASPLADTSEAEPHSSSKTGT
jgi:Sec-independent protein translocase protein TatA